MIVKGDKAEGPKGHKGNQAMSGTSQEAKRALRAEVLARVAGMSEAEMRGQEEALEMGLCAWLSREFGGGAGPVDGRARGLLVYVGMKGEIGVDGVAKWALGAGWRVFVPRVDWGKQEMDVVEVRDWEEVGRWARSTLGLVKVPTGLAGVNAFGSGSSGENVQIDAIIVPGIAFDRHGHRLGRGKGFYDRWLRGVQRAALIGAAFCEQIVEAVPVEAHDVAMHSLASADGVEACRVK